MRTGKIVIHVTNSLKGKRYRFRAYSTNGRILCHSEQYNSRAACKKGITALMKITKIVEL